MIDFKKETQMNNRYLITNDIRKFMLYQKNLNNISKYRPHFTSKDKAIKAGKMLYMQELKNRNCKIDWVYICMYDYGGHFKRCYRLGYIEKDDKWILI